MLAFTAFVWAGALDNVLEDVVTCCFRLCQVFNDVVVYCLLLSTAFMSVVFLYCCSVDVLFKPDY